MANPVALSQDFGHTVGISLALFSDFITFSKPKQGVITSKSVQSAIAICFSDLCSRKAVRQSGSNGVIGSLLRNTQDYQPNTWLTCIAGQTMVIGFT
jgi:hypothetical protein